jgi:hypothetical protein
VEERAGVRRLDQRRRVERAIAERAIGVGRRGEEATVVWERGERRVARRFDTGIEVTVAATAESGVGASVGVAGIAPDGEELGAP